jgi:hypothetical protein
VLAVAVLLLNDHVLKQVRPGLLTGKLSDVAGLVFFPLLLGAAVEIGVRAATGRAWRSARSAAVCVLVTGVVFAAAELSPSVSWWLAVAWGHLQGWVPFGPGAGAPVVFTPDVTDLLALPVLIVPWIVGRRRAAR